MEAVSSSNLQDYAITNSKIGLGAITNSNISETANIDISKILHLQSNFDTLNLTLDSKSPSDNPTFTGIVVLPSTTSIGNTTSTEISYIHGATSPVQTQLNNVSDTISSHSSSTTNVHGISNTAELATKSYADTKKSEAITASEGYTDSAIFIEVTNRNSAIAAETSNRSTAVTNAISTAEGYTDSAISTEVTNRNSAIATAKSQAEGYTDNAISDLINGAPSTLDTLAEIASALGSDANLSTTLTNSIALKAPIASPTFTGTVSGITKSMVGLGSVDNTSDANKPVSTAAQTALDAKAPLASPTFTGTVTLPTGTVTSGMILDGTIVDADINASAAIAQSKISGLSTSLGLKANLDSPALTGTPTAPTATAGTNTTQVATTAFVGTAVSNLIASAPGALDTLNELATALGDDASFSTTMTNALAAKAPLASPTFTGTVSGITKSMVGLGSVDNTADTAKPISTATQTALDLKAPLASPTFTGTVSGITKSMVGLGSVDNTADTAKPISTATQTALNAKLDSATAATTYETITNVALKAPLDSPTFTGTVNAAAVSTSGNVIVGGNLTVNGTTTTINSTTLNTTEQVLVISNTNTPTDVTANGAGITIKGDTDKTVKWYSSTGSLTSSENINLASGKTYKIAGTTVLSPTQVGGQTIPASAIVGLTDTQTLTNKTLTSPAITLPSAGITFSDSTIQTVAGVPSITPINNSVFTTGVVNLATGYKDYMMAVAASVTVTLQQDSAATYPIGSSVDFYATGTGALFAAGTSATIINTPGLKFRAIGSVATAMKVAANTWLVFGDLTA